MITNKDISIDSENGKITLNGNKYDLGTQGEIDTAVKDVYSVMGQNGAKNLNSYPYNETTHSDNGIDWTDNGDGTVTANNTATGNSGFVCHSRVLSSVNKLIVPNGTYILSGCPSGGSSTTFNIGATITKNGSAMALGTDNGSGATITVNGDDNYTDKAVVQIICNIKSGVEASNLTFKPMLRLASDTDNTYEPYAMTNKQLTDALSGKQDTLTFDDAPTAESTNPVTSEGIKTYIDTKIGDVKSSILMGRESFPAAEIGEQEVQVNFPAAFAHAPAVMVSWDDTSALQSYFKYPLRVTDITTTGFIVKAERIIATSTWYFRYIAIDIT